MKLENKWKRKGIKVLPALEDKNPWRNLRENDKNSDWKPWPIKEREKSVLKKFESDWTRENSVFKKLCMRFSIDRKLDSIDRKCLRLIQNQSSSDWNGQIQTKILIAFSIGRAIGSIDQKFGKQNFLKNKAILCRKFSKHSILWIKCMSMRWNALQKHLYWTQISQK